MVRKKNKKLKSSEKIIPELSKEVSKEEIIEISKSYNFNCEHFNFAESGSNLTLEDYTIDEKINHHTKL